MAAPYNNIAAKAERAGVAYVLTQSIGTSNVVRGKRAAEKTAPLVLIYAKSAIETDKGSGNWTVKLVAEAHFPLGDTDETEAASDELSGRLIDCWMQTDSSNPNFLADQLSAQIADFTVMGANIDREKAIESGVDAKGGCWVDSITIELYCCGSDIS